MEIKTIQNPTPTGMTTLGLENEVPVPLFLSVDMSAQGQVLSISIDSSNLTWQDREAIPIKDFRFVEESLY